MNEIAAELTARDLPPEAVHLAVEAASWARDAAPGERRALALLVAALLEARAAGSTRLELAAAAQSAVAPLAEALVAGRPPAALAALFGRPGDYRPFIVDGQHLYAERELRLEQRLGETLGARLARADLPARDPAALEAALAEAGSARDGRPLTDEQLAALGAALRRPLTVVSGGPGTGKTALAVAIVRALARLGLPSHEVALAAPTGKAANRLAESLQAALGAAAAAAPAPQTLHRLLGYRGRLRRAGADGGEFRHHENDPLPHRAVLVDEASMIDLELMERLARAVRADARLILLGDADQLPSVEAGAVFRDLAAYAMRLTRSHRLDPEAPAGAAVLAAARAVRDGDAAALEPPRRARASELTFDALELLEPAATAGPGAERRLLSSFLDRWYEARVRALAGADGLAARAYLLRGDHFDDRDAVALAALLAHHASLRVLTVTRGAHNPTGAEAVNRALARRAASAAGAAGEAFPAGAPVMMTRNDYDRGLYNGDQGVAVRIVSAGAAPRLAAVFPGAGGARFAVFPLEALRHDLTLAYATTVHKAQGAELDHAALILPERDLPLFSRELVYTALTRARRSVVVVGRWARLVEAAARPLARSTGLQARLGR